jgi:hypothetical protein
LSRCTPTQFDFCKSREATTGSSSGAGTTSHIGGEEPDGSNLLVQIW